MPYNLNSIPPVVVFFPSSLHLLLFFCYYSQKGSPEKLQFMQMNDPKIDFQGRIQLQHNHGLMIADRGVEFGSHTSSQLFGAQQQNMGIWSQPQQQQQQQQPCTMEQPRLSQLQNLVTSPNNKPSSTIMSRFESLASAFYAAERCMGFPPQYDSEVGFSPPPPPPLNPHFSSIDATTDQSEPKFDFRAYGHDHNRQFSVSSKENQDLGGYCGTFNSPISQVSFASHQEKQSPRFSSGNGCISTVNSASTGPGISSKTRIRWTQDLHEKFVECVHRLGGAEKATPKAILKLMDSEGLTIFHVKSHLQKYRIAKYLPDSSEGKSEKRPCINLTPQLEATTGLQIKEALQLQLDVQRRLHEQLEVQRTLQLQIEEQGRQLKMMFDMQQRTSNSFFKSQTSDISSPNDDDDGPSNNSIDEVQVSIAEASGNTQFPSKIS